MELIQFKSINGRKFKNLRMVWAAINPDDDDEGYNVERLDPAQKDRFHIYVNVPYEPDKEYFTRTYGVEAQKIAVKWWHELTKENKALVSPRRLDYMLDIFNKGCGDEVAATVPQQVPVTPLITQLRNGSVISKLHKLVAEKGDIKGFLADENNYALCSKTIVEDAKLTKACLPHISEERQTVLATQHKQIETHIFDNFADYEPLIKVFANGPSVPLASKAKRILNEKYGKKGAKKDAATGPEISLTIGGKLKVVAADGAITVSEGAKGENSGTVEKFACNCPMDPSVFQTEVDNVNSGTRTQKDFPEMKAFYDDFLENTPVDQLDFEQVKNTLKAGLRLFVHVSDVKAKAETPLLMSIFASLIVRAGELDKARLGEIEGLPMMVKKILYVATH
jgi:hypothetical protein